MVGKQALVDTWGSPTCRTSSISEVHSIMGCINITLMAELYNHVQMDLTLIRRGGGGGMMAPLNISRDYSAITLPNYVGQRTMLNLSMQRHVECGRGS